MTALSALLGLAAFAAAIIILIHAFKASTGQGLLCLCIPFYIFYYGFARFEHEKKNLILAIMIGAFALNIVLALAGGLTAFGR